MAANYGGELFVMIFIFLIVTLTPIISGNITRTQLTPTITIPGLGPLFGETVHFTTNEYPFADANVDVYRGIRYGEAPVRDRRFAKPVASGQWEGDYNATYFRPECPQSTGDEEELSRQSEDCLFINVWTPHPKPINATVMVWFYGGGFLFGSGSDYDYEGTPLVALNDVIYVNFNYRINSFGFMTTGDSELPGNYGLWDQNLALKWIKDNIAAFGGNPNNIVIWGQSAGGAGVGLQLVSSHGRDLYQRAILQSGNAMMPWAVEYDREKYTTDAYAMGSLAGCDGEYANTREFVACMRALPWQNITAATNLIIIQVKNILPFVPVVDGDFLTDKPVNLLSQGNFKQCDILIGSVKDEGSLIAIRAFVDQVPRRNPYISKERFEASLPQYVYNYNNDIILDAIQQQYVDWTLADDPDANYFYYFIELDTDEAFKCPADATARAHIRGGNDVYMYHMTYKPSNGFLGDLPTWQGVAHADDLQFIFGWHFIPEKEHPMTAIEVNMTLDTMRYWTNFATTGNPNLRNREAKQDDTDTTWHKYTIPTLDYKILEPEMRNSRALKAKECHFWNDVIPKTITFTADLPRTESEYREEVDSWKQNDMPQWRKAFDEYKEP